MGKNYELNTFQKGVMHKILSSIELDLPPLSADLTMSEFAYEVETIKAITSTLLDDEQFFNTKNCEDICILALKEIKGIIEGKIEELRGIENDDIIICFQNGSTIKYKNLKENDKSNKSKYKNKKDEGEKTMKVREFMEQLTPIARIDLINNYINENNLDSVDVAERIDRLYDYLNSEWGGDNE